MFNHIMLGADDVAVSKRFYDAVLGALGIEPGTTDENGRCLFRTSGGTLMLKNPIDGEAASHGNGSTIGFRAGSTDEVDAWHAAGVANGGTTCEDPPGLRPSGVYLAYLRDPIGNKLCAVFRP